MKKNKLQILTFVLSILGATAFGQTDSTYTEPVVVEEDFFDLSLEDLLGMEVTSVSKKAERLQDVASSIYVLTSEDIKNSGATNLHEALRSVPGYWGVQDEYSSVSPVMRNSPVENGNTGTVLYLLDGTPIQDLMSSNFSFKNFDIPLDEIDRIEVIRGSGGTIYGANSATGVVNIFTKSPEKYDGITARAEVAAPGYTNVTVRAGGKINDDLSISGYAKSRTFSGYGRAEGMQGDSVWVSKPDGSGNTLIKNRFTEDFESTKTLSGGLKAVYKLGEDSKLSFNSHFNTSKQTEYTNFDKDVLDPTDSLIANDVTRSRFVGNLRFDHDFSENHSLFARVSTNMENDFLKILGGYKINNSIIDLEIQDNISLGKYNDLSGGVNYRTVNFDVNSVNDKEGLVYLNPQSTQTLKGAFLQDKVKLLDGKVNFILGMKAENYSLINSKYYLSPMAKVTIKPTENLTFWGGFTQSYTTPGYNNTNIDLLLAKVSDQSAYAIAYGTLLGEGKTPEEAAAQAPSKAAENHSTGVKNGSKTVPTKYQTWEVGVRTTMEKVVSIESNFYISNITDAIAASPSAVQSNTESPGRQGVSADYYLYGNYIKGTTYGTESMIKIIPVKGIQFEVSHVYTQANWEYQKNDDFDISKLTDNQKDQTPTVSKMPKHVLRMRGSFQLPKGIIFSTEIIYATKFSTQSAYNYQSQRYPNIISGGTTTLAAPNNSRTIVNFKVQKNFLEEKLNVYIFANDIFNEGMVASTNTLNNVTLSKIGAMGGIGATYKF